MICQDVSTSCVTLSATIQTRTKCIFWGQNEDLDAYSSVYLSLHSDSYVCKYQTTVKLHPLDAS